MPTCLSRAQLQELETIIGYTFNNKELLDEAVQAAGFSRYPGGNKRLGLVGDKVLGLFLCLTDFEDNGSIGHMTDFQKTWAANPYLARFGFAKGIDRFVQPSPSARGVIEPSLMATTVEAIFGAIYLDSGKSIAAVAESVIHMGLIDL